MNGLDNTMVKMSLIVVVAGVLVFMAKTYEKQLGTNVSYSLMGLVAVAALYALIVVNSEESESFEVDDNMTLSDTTESTVGEFNNLTQVVNNDPENKSVNTPAAQVTENNSVNTSDVPQVTENNPVEGPSAAEQLGTNEQHGPVADLFKTSNAVPDQCYPKDILSADDLLPMSKDSTWAQSVPAGQGSLTDQNFLNAGYHLGVNTVGQSLRNANRQIRSDPPCPRRKVSPWLQSTIEPDTNRKALEIGV
jgi:hypothetical protein